MKPKTQELAICRRALVRVSRRFDPRRQSLDAPLFTYASGDVFTHRDSFEGALIVGSPGTGKTTGSGQTHARAMLRAGFGGLVLSAKANERDRFVGWCQAEGRLGSLMVVSPENEDGLNFLQYEMSRPGRGAGMTENIASLFSTVLERSAGGTYSHMDPFWPNAARQLMRNIIDLLRLSTGRVTIPAMVKVIRSAPRSLSEVSSEAWQSHSFCFRLIRRASRRQLDRVDRGDLKQTVGYWLQEFPSVAERVRSSIISTFTAVADGMLRGRLRQMFSGPITYVPELMESGAIILVDIPTKEYHEAGQGGQTIVKLLSQRFWEGRIENPHPWPSFLYVDESQNFINSHDTTFLQSSRESRVATVFITQNLPNFYAAFGGHDGRSKVDSLLGNFATKVFHANSDTTTNRYAEEIIGKAWCRRYSGNVSLGNQGVQSGIGFSDSYESVLPSSVFTMLKQGGEKNNFLAEAIVFKAGRSWNVTDKNYLRVSFPQRI
jgi:hypothetical protein